MIRPFHCAGTVMLLGLVVLAGWAAGLPELTRLRPGWSAMQPLTAVSFVLAGMALHLFAGRRWPGVRLLLLPLIAIPASALVQDGVGDFPGIDTLLFPTAVRAQPDLAFPGRMAQVAACEFLLFSLFLAWPRRTPGNYRRASRIATLGLLVAAIGLTGYLLGARELARIGGDVSMAAHTAFGFILLFTGALQAQRDPNWLHGLFSPAGGARLVRRLLAYIFGWMVLLGLSIPVLDPLVDNARLEYAVFVVVLLLVLIVGLVRFAKRFNRAEAQRQRAEAAFLTAEVRLGRVLDSTLDAVVTIDETQRILYFNPAAEKAFGYTAAEVIGTPVDRLIPERFRAAHPEYIRRFGQTGETNRSMGRLGALAALRRDGGEFPVEASISQNDANGQHLFTAILRDITERLQAEERLRASEEKYRTLFTSMTEGFGLGEPVFDSRGKPVDVRFLEVNDAFYRQTGIPIDILGRPVRESLPQMEQFWIDRLAAVAQTGIADRMENYNADTRRHYDLYAFRPSPGRFAILFRDITEQKRMAEILRESETRFRATFEQAAVGMAHVALDGHWLQVNDRLCEIVGYERAALLGLSFQDITYLSDLTADLEQVEQLLAGAIPSYSLEKRYVRRDGARIWINLTVSLVRTAAGEPDYFIKVVEDIEARKQAEAALRESEERLKLFIRHAPASLAMFDADMRYLAASRRWMEDYALAEQDVIGRCHYDVFPDIPEYWKVVHRRGLAGEVISNGEDRYERADGSVQWLRWEVRPWQTDGGQVGGIVIFAEDITRYKLAVDEIQHLNADLERRVEERTAELTAANRELDSFANAVSHDLRAPLRAINGYTRMLEEHGAGRLEGEAARFLEQIRLAGAKMGDLIDGILALSRIGRGDLRCDEVDLSAMAERLLKGLAAVEPERRVRWEIEAGLAARGDARLLESVMGNLLGNAWKYTGKTPEAVIRVYRDGDGFCIADNGAGFDPGHAAQLFQPFRRLHKQSDFPGIGIGLATVRRIIQRHGGEIGATATPGQGAVFRFTLGQGAPAGDGR